MEEQQNQNSAILKELSDIKASLAVNTSETANIKDVIAEIKQDLREIKIEAVTRSEFSENAKNTRDHESRIRTLEAFRWQLLGGILTFQALADFILYKLLQK